MYLVYTNLDGVVAKRSFSSRKQAHDWAPQWMRVARPRGGADAVRLERMERGGPRLLTRWSASGSGWHQNPWEAGETVPQLTKKQSDARTAELRRMGCKVKTVDTPRGTYVLKNCPKENPMLPSDKALWFEYRGYDYWIERVDGGYKSGASSGGWGVNMKTLFSTRDDARAAVKRWIDQDVQSGGSTENPISKTTETLITIGAIAGGIGLLVWMIKEMAPKKKTEAAPPGGVLPVSTNEPTYRVFQRYIDGLDTQGMKCTAPQLVFEGPRSRANDLAWRITTREPVGGRGLVAVAVPVDFFVTSECNWRRLCMADGSCMGVIGLQG